MAIFFRLSKTRQFKSVHVRKVVGHPDIDTAVEFPSPKPYMKSTSAYSALINHVIFVVATVLVSGTTVRV